MLFFALLMLRLSCFYAFHLWFLQRVYKNQASLSFLVLIYLDINSMEICSQINDTELELASPIQCFYGALIVKIFVKSQECLLDSRRFHHTITKRVSKLVCGWLPSAPPQSRLEANLVLLIFLPKVVCLVYFQGHIGCLDWNQMPGFQEYS